MADVPNRGAGTPHETPKAPTPRHNDAGDGWTLAMELLTATFVWGGIGWLLDRWLGTAPVLMAIGFVLGNALGVYLIWLRSKDRFNRDHEDLLAARARRASAALSFGRHPDRKLAGPAAATPAVGSAPHEANELRESDVGIEVTADVEDSVAPLYPGPRDD